MSTVARIAIVLAALTAVASGEPVDSAAAASKPVKIGPGLYRPIFPASPAEKEVRVDAFLLDRTPVTNAQYLAFVREHPEWRRDRIEPLFSDENYLVNWQNEDSFGIARPDAPVVRVSWFAARAYCAARGGRLPLEHEWELAAGASAKKLDATRDPAFQTRVLAWYTQLTPPVLPDVGGAPNAWGVSDMHGLVWEWIEDFSASLVEADSRDPARNVFCGGTGANSRDANAYAAFMRIAFRSSLDARSTTGVLGFRCAYDLPRTSR